MSEGLFHREDVATRQVKEAFKGPSKRTFRGGQEMSWSVRTVLR